MLEIVFEYRDQYTNGRWNRQSCKVSSVEECKKKSTVLEKTVNTKSFLWIRLRRTKYVR